MEAIKYDGKRKKAKKSEGFPAGASASLTSLVAGLQQVAARLVRDSRELGPVAGQPGPAQRTAVLLQSGQLGRRRLDLGHAVDQLRVLLAQTRLAEMVHHCQHLSSLSPAEERARGGRGRKGRRHRQQRVSVTDG